MADVERGHLRTAPTAGRRDREAHLVVDIHERQRPGGVGPGPGDERALRTQRRELVADAAAGAQRQPRLVYLGEDVVHGVAHGPGHGAVDRRGRRLVLLGTGVGDDAPRRDRAVAQRPDEALVPALAQFRGRLDIGQGTGHAAVGVIDGLVDDGPALALEAVLLVPDIERGLLQRNVCLVCGYNFQARRLHVRNIPPGD